MKLWILVMKPGKHLWSIFYRFWVSLNVVTVTVKNIPNNTSERVTQDSQILWVLHRSWCALNKRLLSLEESILAIVFVQFFKLVLFLTCFINHELTNNSRKNPSSVMAWNMSFLMCIRMLLGTKTIQSRPNCTEIAAVCTGDFHRKVEGEKQNTTKKNRMFKEAFISEWSRALVPWP